MSNVLSSRFSLAEEACNETNAFLQSHGSHLPTRATLALSSLLKALEKGLRGELAQGYHLASLDPGIGKTSAVSNFLRVWKRREFRPAGSVLIGVSRLDEIQTYVTASGLTKADFGVFTSDATYNALGVADARHDTVPVQFTTQQMILSRTKGRSFREADEFHYQGQPRTLRLWDETLLPALPITIRLDHLRGLASPLRAAHPEFVAAIDEFASSITEADKDGVVKVPSNLGELLPRFRWRGEASRLGLTPELCKTIDDVGLVSASELLLQSDPLYGLTLVGSSVGLPPDFSPAVVLDASGRVRETYRLWEKHRGTLYRLPAATNNYRNLDIHIWETGSGKQAWSRQGTRRKLLGPIADVINQDTEARWLIVHYKADREGFLENLRSLVESNPERVQALTWGRHHGTNVFAGVENIVLVGQVTYRGVDYVAHALAASGLHPSEAQSIDVRAVRRGEFQHHVLQALCRASVRRSLNGVAGRCKAYVITSPSQTTESVFRETFPGARLIEWQTPIRPLTGRVGEAAAYVEDRFADEAVERVAKGEVSNAVGMSKSSFRNNVLRHEDFLHFLAGQRLTTDTRYIKRVVSEFDQLDDED